MNVHADRYQDRIVGGIINVYQSGGPEWPLQIFDHFFRTVKITLKPGEMLMYESASLIHGRPTFLEMEAFANYLIHYISKDWHETETYKYLLNYRDVSSDFPDFISYIT